MARAPRDRPLVAPLAPVVAETVRNCTLLPEDKAAAALASRYAATIDQAAELAEEARRIPFDPDVHKQVQVLAAKVAAHQVMLDLGPKLLACLNELGATPKARAVVAKPAAPAGGGRLQSLRTGKSA